MRLALRLVRRRLADGAGFTLVELITTMAIMLTVMGGLTALMVAGTKSQVDQNRRFEAQTEARLGLDRLRRESHCAKGASPAGVSASVTLDTTTCTNAGASSVTWCTVGTASRSALWRYLGGSCSGTGVKVADYLTTQSAFNYLQTSGSLSKLGITLAVNLTPSRPQSVYTLSDEIVLRNSARNA